MAAEGEEARKLICYSLSWKRQVVKGPLEKTKLEVGVEEGVTLGIEMLVRLKFQLQERGYQKYL